MFTLSPSSKSATSFALEATVHTAPGRHWLEGLRFGVLRITACLDRYKFSTRHFGTEQGGTVLYSYLPTYLT